jgi:L-amino acid N-acyltransferase YncA
MDAAGAVIRAATEDDLAAVAGLYAHYVEHTSITFDLEAPGVEAWREKLHAAAAAGHPWLVADAGGTLAGYATASSFRPKAAYGRTVETTIYLAPGAGGAGLGRRLYGALLEAVAAAGFHLAVAGVTLPNPASVALHERLGFVPVGTFREVGRKHGSWHDVGWWQRPLAG